MTLIQKAVQAGLDYEAAKAEIMLAYPLLLIVERYANANGYKQYPESKFEISDVDEETLYLDWDYYNEPSTFELPVEMLDEVVLAKYESDRNKAREAFAKQQKEQIDALKRKQLESLKAYFGEA